MATSYLAALQDSTSKMWQNLLEGTDSEAFPLARNIVAAAIAGLVIFVTTKKLRSRSARKALQERINERKKARAKQLAYLEATIAVRGVLVTPDRKDILELSTEDLIAKMKSGDVKCIDVLRAFQAKAIEVTKEINCVVEFINEAEEWSRALDMAPNDDLPLLGLPVSIKEDFAITNYDTTLGYAKFIGKKHSTDATVVATLKQLGAVPFCRTNLPQTVISYACSNPIYGATKNPHNPSRGPGGSSGGEAALIAAGGSFMGIGDDIGGSVRIPALFCGIASLKPTTGRLSDNGQTPSLPGVQGMRNSPGIMAKDVDTVIVGAKAVFSSGLIHEIDPPSMPIPWREELYSGKSRLRIGYYDSSNVFPPTPGVKRAHAIAVEALKRSGHELIQFECPDSFEIMDRMCRLYAADGAKYVLASMENENVDPALQDQHTLNNSPKWLLKMLHPLLRKVAKRGSFISADSHTHQLWKSMTERQEFINNTIRKWRASRLDLLLVPGFAFPAVPHNTCGMLFSAIVYTALFNHLDFPAGVVTVTKESAEDQGLLDSYDTQGDYILKLAKKVVGGSEGLPLGVQVVGLPWQEELVLRGMKELQDSLKRM